MSEQQNIRDVLRTCIQDMRDALQAEGRYDSSSYEVVMSNALLFLIADRINELNNTLLALNIRLDNISASVGETGADLHDVKQLLEARLHP